MYIMSLPSEYRHVEYLESTSAKSFPYIFIESLGTNPPSKGEYKIKMRRYDGGEIRIMGYGSDEYTSEYDQETASRNCCNVIGGSKWVKDYFTSVNYGCNWKNLTASEIGIQIDPVGTDLEIDYVFEPGKQILTINGKTITLDFSFNPYTSGYKGFYLFRVNHAMSRMSGSTRIYYAKVYENGVLKADLVPVAKGTVGYMYDSVSDSLLASLGSGQFVVGDEICKFKDPSNKQLCKLIYGCCQYQQNGFEDGLSCSIRSGYKDAKI